MPPSIVVRRTRRDRDGGIDYVLDIDGTQRGTLRRGKTLVVDVAPGRHHARMRVDSTGSRVLEVDLGADERVYLLAKPVSVWTHLRRIVDWILSGNFSLQRDALTVPNSWVGTDGWVDLRIDTARRRKHALAGDERHA